MVMPLHFCSVLPKCRRSAASLAAPKLNILKAFRQIHPESAQPMVQIIGKGGANAGVIFVTLCFLEFFANIDRYFIVNRFNVIELVEILSAVNIL